MSNDYTMSWLSDMPEFRQWADKQELDGRTVETRFTLRDDGTWSATTVKGETLVGGPVTVDGHPTKAACERAMREELSKRLRQQLGQTDVDR